MSDVLLRWAREEAERNLRDAKEEASRLRGEKEMLEADLRRVKQDRDEILSHKQVVLDALTLVKGHLTLLEQDAVVLVETKVANLPEPLVQPVSNLTDCLHAIQGWQHAVSNV